MDSNHASYYPNNALVWWYLAYLALTILALTVYWDKALRYGTKKQHATEQTQNTVEHRPVFMPRVTSDNLVKTDMVRFERHVGFASRQKEKSINDLHQVIRKKYGFQPRLRAL